MRFLVVFLHLILQKIYVKKITFLLVIFVKNDVCEAKEAACMLILLLKSFSLSLVSCCLCFLIRSFCVTKESPPVMKTDCSSCRVIK
jgi:hypothetical protein